MSAFKTKIVCVAAAAVMVAMLILAFALPVSASSTGPPQLQSVANSDMLVSLDNGESLGPPDAGFLGGPNNELSIGQVTNDTLVENSFFAASTSVSGPATALQWALLALAICGLGVVGLFKRYVKNLSKNYRMLAFCGSVIRSARDAPMLVITIFAITLDSMKKMMITLQHSFVQTDLAFAGFPGATTNALGPPAGSSFGGHNIMKKRHYSFAFLVGHKQIPKQSAGITEMRATDKQASASTASGFPADAQSYCLT